MAITPYDQASWSQYTPLTGQEILQPALLQRERHDKIDEEYAAINDLSQQIAFIAENETDPRVKQRYRNYMNQLQGGMETLMDRGVTPNSRREMLNLRSKFQSDLAPLKQGYEMKLQDMNIYNQMMMKDPTWRGPSPANRSVMDYVDNGLQPFAQTGYSGEALYKQAAEMAKPYSQILNSNNPEKLMIDQFGAQYLNFKHGYGPEDDEAKIAMDFITETIMNANAPSLDWARDNQGNLNPNEEMYAKQHIKRAITQMIGKDNMVGNKMWEHLSSEDRQIKAEKRAEERAANEAAAKGIPLTNFNKYPGRAFLGDRRDLNTDGKNSNLIELATTGRLKNPLRTSEKDKVIYNKAVELHKSLGDLTDAELESYFSNPENSVTYSGRSTDMVVIPKDRDVTENIKESFKVIRDYNRRKDMEKNMADKLGMSLEDAKLMTDSYINNTATLYGIDFEANDEKLSKGEIAQLESSKNRIFNAESGTVFYIDGKKVDMKKVKEKYGQKMSSEANKLGYSTYNPYTGGSTANFNYVTDDGKVITAEVPELNFSNVHQSSGTILNNILKSNSPTPRNVKLPSGEDVTVFSDFDGNGWQHYVQVGDQIITLDQLESMEQQGLAKNWLERSKTVAQATK